MQRRNLRGGERMESEKEKGRVTDFPGCSAYKDPR